MEQILVTIEVITEENQQFDFEGFAMFIKMFNPNIRLFGNFGEVTGIEEHINITLNEYGSELK